MVTAQELFDDLVDNIDNIYPQAEVTRGINNREKYVQCQNLLDYLILKHNLKADWEPRKRP